MSIFSCRSSISKVQKTYNTYHTTYDELLSTDNGLSFRQRHLHFLVTEVFRPVANLNPKFLWGYFNVNRFPHDLEKKNTLQHSPTCSTHHGIDSLLFEVVFFGINLLENLRKAFPTYFKKIRREEGATSMFMCIQVG